eukprot:15484768-Alexandrium_andersonii.AAC.2
MAFARTRSWARWRMRMHGAFQRNWILRVMEYKHVLPRNARTAAHARSTAWAHRAEGGIDGVIM